jgi:hypothetical protein
MSCLPLPKHRACYILYICTNASKKQKKGMTAKERGTEGERKGH